MPNKVAVSYIYYTSALSDVRLYIFHGAHLSLRRQRDRLHL